MADNATRIASLEAEQKLSAPHAAVVFLHGSGDTGEGFQEWIASVHQSFFDELTDLNFEFAFPTAELIRYTLCGGQPMSVWHDRADLHITAKEDLVGIKKSVARIDNIIDSFLARGIPLKRIFLFGLSMGGHLALQMLGFSKHRIGLAGVVALSCFLSRSSQIWEELAICTAAGTLQKLPPVLMSHGDADDLVLFEWGQVTSDRLRQTGLQVSFSKIHGLGHELSRAELHDLLVAIKQSVATE